MQDELENPFRTPDSDRPSNRESTSDDSFAPLSWSNGTLRIRIDVSIRSVLRSLALFTLAISLPAILVSWVHALQYSTSFLGTLVGFYVGPAEFLALALTQLEPLTGFYMAKAFLPKTLAFHWRFLSSLTLLFFHSTIGAFLMLVRFEGGLPKLFGLIDWANCIELLA